MAKAKGLSKGYIMTIEAREFSQNKTMAIIAKALGVEASEILEGGVRWTQIVSTVQILRN